MNDLEDKIREHYKDENISEQTIAELKQKTKELKVGHGKFYVIISIIFFVLAYILWGVFREQPEDRAIVFFQKIEKAIHLTNQSPSRVKISSSMIDELGFTPSIPNYIQPESIDHLSVMKIEGTHLLKVRFQSADKKMITLFLFKDDKFSQYLQKYQEKNQKLKDRFYFSKENDQNMMTINDSY